MNARTPARFIALSAIALMGLCAPATASFSNLSQWTAVQDPPHPQFTATATAAAATLAATGGPVPGATDIGYQSVNGQTFATSTSGWAFDPSSNFSLAIDFDLRFASSPTGMLGIGFGIGEDADGTNSAGAVLLSSNGAPFVPLPFAALARINDVTQSPQAISLPGTLAGTFFASYDAATGDVMLGASATPGALAPSATTAFSGIQNLWNDEPLLASFFLRSEAALGQPWQSGQATATFSNVRILGGTPTAVPEPGVLSLLLLVPLAIRRPHRNSSFSIQHS